MERVGSDGWDCLEFKIPQSLTHRIIDSILEPFIYLRYLPSSTQCSYSHLVTDKLTHNVGLASRLPRFLLPTRINRGYRGGPPAGHPLRLTREHDLVIDSVIGDTVTQGPD